MKLKQLPEDFKVEELNELKPSKEGEYKLYLLEKKSLETFSLLNYLSRKNRIPIQEFGIAGLKDRHAITKQYLTIPKIYEISTLKENNFNLTFLGYVPEKLKLGDLKGNKFEITVRDVKKGELEGVYKKAETIEQTGVPNYFDSQRFGSAINKEFIAKHLIRKEYEQAVKIYLAQSTRFESSKIKKEKTQILQNWKNLEKTEIKSPTLKPVVEEYKKTKNWLEAYKRIPSKLREIMISAYQSYLWNECVKRALIAKIDKKKIYTIDYSLGKLIFYKNLTEKEARNIPETFKTINENTNSKGFEQDIINNVLNKEGITIKEFDIKKQTGNFFTTYERKTLLKPANFTISQPKTDEINDRGRKNKYKITLSFTLPKGSYATMITKRVFNQ